MSTHYDDCSMFERQTRHDIVEAEHARIVFLSQPSVMLGLCPVLDGDSWCVLYGGDLQSGVCGYGDTPQEAMEDFDKHWNGK